MSHKRMVKFKIVSSVVLILSCLGTGYGQTIAQVNNLTNSLFSGYNKYTRPVNNQSATVNVSVPSLYLLALRDFDDVLGKLSTGISFYLEWNDESLVWDPITNNGVAEITVSQNSIWKPMLTLTNPYDELKELGNKDWVTCGITYDGVVSWEPITSLDSTCSINTMYYPFDEQICRIQLFVFGYSWEEVALLTERSALDLTFYGGHSTWTITTASVTSTNTGYSSFLLISLHMKRQPTFIVVNFLVPILLLAFLNPLIFFLPTDSGERIGYSITILLSLSVFMTILGDYIPQNSDPMSLLAYMLMTLYICSSSIVMLVFFSMKVYFISETKHVNKAARAFVRICSCRCFKKAQIQPEEKDDSKLTKVQTIYTGGDESIIGGLGGESDSETVSWKDVSHAIDTCSCVLMYTAVIIVAVVFLSVLIRSD